MLNPWTISEKQVEIAHPTFDWEEYDGREICEGPQLLPGKNGKPFIVYSASACWDDNYFLGQLTASANGNLLEPASWTKAPSPVFSRSVANGVYGPGHNCFTKSMHGTQDWIVYHAKCEAKGKCQGRNPRAQSFSWKADGSPDFGALVPESAPAIYILLRTRLAKNRAFLLILPRCSGIYSLMAECFQRLHTQASSIFSFPFETFNLPLTLRLLP